MCILRCQWSIWVFICWEMSSKTTFSLCSESNVSLWETQWSFSFSLNKMKPFLTVHQADPLSLLYPVVLSLTCNSKSICVILFCTNWTGALLSACLTHGRHPRPVQSTEEGLGGVGEGNFTAWMFACLVGTCVQYYPTVTCSTTCRALAWESKLEHTKGLTQGRPFLLGGNCTLW